MSKRERFLELAGKSNITLGEVEEMRRLQDELSAQVEEMRRLQDELRAHPELAVDPCSRLEVSLQKDNLCCRCDQKADVAVFCREDSPGERTYFGLCASCIAKGVYALHGGEWYEGRIDPDQVEKDTHSGIATDQWGVSYLRDTIRKLTIEVRSLRSWAVVLAERDHAQRVEVPDAFHRRDEMKEILRELSRPACAVCGSLLTGLIDIDSDTPPHCEDCRAALDEEAIHEWENTRRPDLKRRIDAALGEPDGGG